MSDVGVDWERRCYGYGSRSGSCTAGSGYGYGYGYGSGSGLGGSDGVTRFATIEDMREWMRAGCPIE